MAFDASQTLQQGKSFVLGLSPKQKLLIAVSTILAVGGLWIFVSLLGQQDYQVLYSNLQSAEANMIAKRLAKEGNLSKLSSDGKSLSVPGNRLERARISMAEEGLPETGRLGFEIFNQTNWGESDFAEKVNYQRALQGELERTIQDLTDVAAVRVHLVMPHESLFTEQEREAKASVLVKSRNGQLSQKSLRAITYLVASAVDTLKPSNVTVVDADGNVPFVLQGGLKSNSPEGSAQYEQKLNQKLSATLTPILGADHFVARATVEYETSSTDNTREIYDPKDAVVLTSQVTRDLSSGAMYSGIPGADSNVPQDELGNGKPAGNAKAAKAAADNAGKTAPNDSASSKGKADNASSTNDSASDTSNGGTASDSKTYAVGRTVVHTEQPPGTIRKISAAILVDDAVETKMVSGKATEVRVPRTPDQMKKIQALAAAVLGLDPSRGDMVTVENIPFHITPLQAAPPLTGMKKIEQFLNRNGYLVRYIVLGLLALVFILFGLRPLANQIGVAVREMPRALPEARRPAPALSGAVGEIQGPDMALEDRLSISGGEHPPAGERPRMPVLKKNLATRVASAPVESSHLIRGWLKEQND